MRNLKSCYEIHLCSIGGFYINYEEFKGLYKCNYSFVSRGFILTMRNLKDSKLMSNFEIKGVLY